MILNMTMGQNLNFRVVAGTSEPTQLTENTLWVETDTAANGWMLQPEQPGTAVAGLIWIQTGNTGSLSFNALKANAIRLNITGCQQYVDGAWEDKPLQLWQSGQWKALTA